MKCTHDDKCPGRAVWRPLLETRPSVKSPVTPAKFTNLIFCEAHKDGARLADFISNSTWDKIVRYMREAGKPAPMRSLTTLRFEVVGSPESTDAEELAF
jgi:hypothetical protein